MTHQKLILEAFVKLGSFFDDYLAAKTKEVAFKSSWHKELDKIVTQAKHYNGWFTEENVLFALLSWSKQLTKAGLETWLANYDINLNSPKTVALIMAGNIPLVGFHDFLVTLITGNKALVKLSSNDAHLLPFIAKYIIHTTPNLKNAIAFENKKLNGFDAVIATGSNNTSRYFEHYFGKYPNIIRKNRNSVAVLTGKESAEQLTALGEDIFRYFGLGCRSVSKIFVPEDYNFELFFKSIYKYNSIIELNKYANNYDYNKAVYSMSEFTLQDNGFLILKNDESYASPIASLFYEYYPSLNEVNLKLKKDETKIQCIVSHNFNKNEVTFGATQKPVLSDYADGIDTVQFLLTT